jgi:tetratricopeptide (TPR) repeat protein
VRADQEAVEVCRKLVDTDPTFYQALVNSLRNLRVDLRNLGRIEDAWHASEEAVELCRKIVETDPSVPKLLAVSLFCVGIDLRLMGRFEDALRADEEATGIFRRIPETEPGAQYLAGSLENLGLNLNAVGRHSDAVHAGEEAARILRELPNRTVELDLRLANTLKLLAAHLRAVDRHVDAPCTDEEGSEIVRKLGETNPDSTARSLYGLAIDFGSIGIHDEALQASEQAVALYSKIQQPTPKVVRDHIQALERLAGNLRALAAHADSKVAILKGSLKQGPRLSADAVKSSR